MTTTPVPAELVQPLVVEVTEYVPFPAVVIEAMVGF
jgi:hypothetical protein